jgi:hypothetical protein
VAVSTTPVATTPTTGVRPPADTSIPITGTVPAAVPTVAGNAPAPQGTGVAPAAVPSTQP